MKKIIFSLIAFIGFALTASAQTAAPATSQPKPQWARAIFDVPSMETEAQFLALKPDLVKIEGVRYSNADYTRHQVVFSYIVDLVSAKQIGEVLAQKGYTNTLNMTSERPQVAPSKE